jgi:hypothetical protein
MDKLKSCGREEPTISYETRRGRILGNRVKGRSLNREIEES